VTEPPTFERPPATIERLVGVYDADGGLVGEARYVIGHLLGRLECALCDITHGPLRRKRDFDALAARLGVPFELVHRNERRPEVAAATGAALPCVVAEVDGEVVTVLDRDDLRQCGGDVAAFEQRLRSALDARTLRLPS
jgi:hypothetical protein